MAPAASDLVNNGFYESTDGGQTFHEVTITGDINTSDIGRTTFAYSADGSKLYAIVESPAELAAGDETSLQGIFVSSGSPGERRRAVDEDRRRGQAGQRRARRCAVGSGYGVGVQAWYNQDLAVDPSNPNHVYAGLEEVFESTNGGTSWVTASPYWNYGLACNPNCPNTTHPDQHSMMVANGKIVIGNDGGVFSRPLSDTQQYGDWTDLNATYASWQYYDARAGELGRHGLGVWGGLQDNGTSLLASGQPQMVEPAGGDGFDVIVDPNNANSMLGEYADGAMYRSTDGGHSFYSDVSPGCDGQATVGLTPLPGLRPVDAVPHAAGARRAEHQHLDHRRRVRVGQPRRLEHELHQQRLLVAERLRHRRQQRRDGAGLDSQRPASSTPPGWAAAAIPGPAFGSGIATNYGGTWHEVNTAGLPNRYIAGMAVDPQDPAHAYAVFNGYSRRWIPGGGVGHVFETYNGGRSWQDISGNLPDIASDALVIAGGRLALATDLGMYTADAKAAAAARTGRGWAPGCPTPRSTT